MCSSDLAGITQFESGPRNIFQQQPAPAVAPTQQPSGGIDLSNIDTTVNTAMNAPPPPPSSVGGKVVGKVSEFLRGQGRAAASLVDTGLNAVTGALDVAAYPLARAYYGMQMSPEAAAERAKAETTSPKNVVGRAFGVSETPEYKGEISQQVMNFIGEHMDKGADWISKQTGIPKPDVESYINTAMLGATPAVKPVARAVKTEAGYALEGVKAVTPKPVQTAVGRVVETVAPGTTNIKPPVAAPTVTAPAQTAPYAQPGRGSVGAAGVSDPAMIRQALSSATPEFQQIGRAHV